MQTHSVQKEEKKWRIWVSTSKKNQSLAKCSLQMVQDVSEENEQLFGK